jgi:signal transduction histidine kinase
MSRKLSEVDKMKLDFLSIVSHELYTPIASIMTGVDALSENPGIADPSKKLLGIMDFQIKKLKGLIDDVMDFSWLDTSKTKPEKEPASIVEIADAAVGDISEEAARRETTVVKACEEGLPTVVVDKRHIRHVLKILLGNAIKFSPKKAQVVLSLRKAGTDRIEISVADNGIGIAPEHLATIFDGFYQVEDPLTRTHGGLGIGLAIAKRFIELHGGTIAAGSKGSGLGSTFTAIIPIR